MDRIKQAKEEISARKNEFRAKPTKLKIKLPNNLPVKLDLGCCFRKPQGYWGTDVSTFTGVDQVFDHTIYPWPLPSNHFKEVRAWHILQYLPDVEKTMEEIWRVAKKGAKVTIGVPYYMSVYGFGDRNKSFFNERTFDAFTEEKSWYGNEMAQLSKAKFKIIYKKLKTTGRVRKLIPFKGFFRYFLWNIIDEMEIHLEVIK